MPTLPPGDASVVEVPAPPPVTEEANVADGETRVVGMVEAIRLTNINKARGKYTFLVEVIVRPDRVSPGVDPQVQRWVAEDMIPVQVSLRIDKLYWGSLSPAQQAALAPGGPAPLLHVDAYGEYTVGEQIDRSVHFTSPGIADPRLVRP